MPSSLPSLDISSFPLFLKLFGGLGIVILGFLARKKIFAMLATERTNQNTNAIAVNQQKENAVASTIVALTQKKQDIQQQITQIDQQTAQNPNDEQVLDFFAAEQQQLNQSNTR